MGNIGNRAKVQFKVIGFMHIIIVCWSCELCDDLVEDSPTGR